MDKQKGCDIPGIHIHQTKEIEEQYQLLNRERSRINEELAHEKADEQQINQKLMRFLDLDRQIEWRMLEIENLQRWDPDKLKLNLPISSVSRTTRVYCLTGKDAQTPVRPDLKRCQKRLVKKGSMDINYLKEVQEEHICSMKSSEIPYSGTQELNDMIESMLQRIHHGNKKRADEMKIYEELSNFLETKESYIAPEPRPHWYTLQRRSKRYTDYDRYRWQHSLSIRLDYIEIQKREQIERQARVKRLKAKLQYVRKKINYLNKKLENIDSKILKAYKRANELGDNLKELYSSWSYDFRSNNHNVIFHGCDL
ncbi:hypothetical protein HanXRQr2_Chr17g0809771 [Helianthus annuus]|uniref:Uncharacterized protein n=1 Tax=Helianthus annuus TaxID=4232 RepID=A0A251RQZ2_HELAN|nr:hypothetical protein HanXRQr2_Chr17g0809771 [Helianthus annuus]